MKIITTREMRNAAKAYFEMAERERVAIKRGDKFVNLLVSDDPSKVFVDEDWVKGLLEIPDEFRCNPFDVSPSGDLYWADKRNVKQLEERVANSGEEPTITIRDENNIWDDIL